MKDLKDCIRSAVFAFRGYNVTNLGRSLELLNHAVYGPIITPILAEASDVCSDVVGRKVDLAERIRSQAPTTLELFPAETTMIVAMEVAQLRILEQVFDVPIRDAKYSCGYSIGEVSALHLGGVFDYKDLLRVPLTFAADCAELARNVTMGVLFTRQEAINLDEVRRMCIEISIEGKGLIGPSAVLSPNTVLLLGENDTMNRVKEQFKRRISESANLRLNQHRWPPMHTPIVWHRSVPNRSAIELHHLAGGLEKPSPPVLSMVTGKASYNNYNSRELLTRWADHPQLLWDVLYEMIVSDAEVVIHVGPEPNLIPSTFQRLATNITSQLGASFLRLGHRFLSNIARSWIANMMSSRSALLRAPFLEHVILEDWLLAQNP